MSAIASSSSSSSSGGRASGSLSNNDNKVVDVLSNVGNVANRSAVSSNAQAPPASIQAIPYASRSDPYGGRRNLYLSDVEVDDDDDDDALNRFIDSDDPYEDALDLEAEEPEVGHVDDKGVDDDDDDDDDSEDPAYNQVATPKKKKVKHADPTASADSKLNQVLETLSTALTVKPRKENQVSKWEEENFPSDPTKLSDEAKKFFIAKDIPALSKEFSAKLLTNYGDYGLYKIARANKEAKISNLTRCVVNEVLPDIMKRIVSLLQISVTITEEYEKSKMPLPKCLLHQAFLLRDVWRSCSLWQYAILEKAAGKKVLHHPHRDKDVEIDVGKLTSSYPFSSSSSSSSKRVFTRTSKSSDRFGGRARRSLQYKRKQPTQRSSARYVKQQSKDKQPTTNNQ